MVALAAAGSVSALAPAASAGASETLCESAGYDCTVGGYAGRDSWGYWPFGSANGAGRHNCTAYAAFRVERDGAADPGNLGDARDWPAAARSKGITVDAVPAVGAIAQWSSGHVAYVDEVGLGWIITTDDNYGWNRTTRQRHTPGSGWPDAFIHLPARLSLVKGAGTPSGHVEVHTATAASGWQGADVQRSTWFSTADAADGTFQLVGRDLLFVKTRNTGSGRVEVHSATAASGYQRAGVQVATWITTDEAADGAFQLVGRDLVFVKTRNTGSGRVEVHSATAGSGYQAAERHAATWISTDDAGNGTFQLRGADLVFIKTRTTGSATVELHTATAASGYQDGHHSTTRFGGDEAASGSFELVGSDLRFVRWRGTASGRVELHSATARSGYQGSNLAATTWFDAAEGERGWFSTPA